MVRKIWGKYFSVIWQFLDDHINFYEFNEFAGSFQLLKYHKIFPHNLLTKAIFLELQPSKIVTGFMKRSLIHM